MNLDVDSVLKECWQAIRSQSDQEPNIRDFWIISETIRLKYAKDEMLQNVPNCDTGLKIVEYIENNIFKDPPGREIYHIVRNLTVDEFSMRMGQIAKYLQFEGYLNGGILKVLSVSFYTWFGCLCMAKSTRVIDSIGTVYNDRLRQREYNWLKNMWEDADKNGNPWIKFGVTVAKCLEEKRKKSNPAKIIVDNWISKDSPYWSCCEQ